MKYANYLSGLLAIIIMAFMSLGVVSCKKNDESDTPQKEKTEQEIILGTWNFINDDEDISITFFDNGAYAHYSKKYHDGYEGFYKLTPDSVIFTIVQSKNVTYNRSVKVIELSENLFIFEGFDLQRISSGIIYDGIYKGSKENKVDEKTAVKYRKDIVGKWNVTYNLYGNQTSTLNIKDNGTFLFYDEGDEEDYYQGTYSICYDKLLFVEDTQKCPIGGLYTINELTNNSFVLVNTYNEQISGSK